MLRIALAYGLPAGAAAILAIIASLALGSEGSQVFGYLIMLVALMTVFVGVKRWRDVDHGGVVKFWPAFGLGLAIAAAAGVAYVAIWEVYLAATDNAFIAEYAAAAVEKAREAGAAAEEIAKIEARNADLLKNYENPFFRLPVTFSEIFPVGVVVALISAALLRNERFMPARGAR